MNKRELVMAASIKSGIIQKNVQKSIEAAFECILESLAVGREISIQNFGRFYVKDMKERNARNPSTGESIVVEAKRIIKFKITPGFTTK
jgi:nucleoid DNA-binding protein